MGEQPYIALIKACRNYLQAHGKGQTGVAEVLNKLAEIPLVDNERYIESSVKSIPSVLFKQLDYALQQVTQPNLASIVNAIIAARDHLPWRIGGSYQPEVIGNSYANGHLYCNLIGPTPGEACIHADDFRLGLYLIASQVFYRDHCHLTPELYLILTERSTWRFAHGDWQVLPAETMVWNESNAVHAIRTDEQPFLCVFAWTQDVQIKPRIMPAADWQAIENSLYND